VSEHFANPANLSAATAASNQSNCSNPNPDKNISAVSEKQVCRLDSTPMGCRRKKCKFSHPSRDDIYGTKAKSAVVDSKNICCGRPPQVDFKAQKWGVQAAAEEDNDALGDTFEPQSFNPSVNEFRPGGNSNATLAEA